MGVELGDIGEGFTIIEVGELPIKPLLPVI
jgi:hypothetical protein